MAATPAPPVQYRVNSTQELLLKISSVVLYLLQLLLLVTVVGSVATEVIGLTGGILYLVWFWFLGANYLGGKVTSKVQTILINSILEAIPFINGIYPGFCVEVWRMVSITKKEDEEKHALRQKKNAEAEAAQTRQQMRALEIRSRQLAANENQEAAANDNEEAQQADAA